METYKMAIKNFMFKFFINYDLQDDEEIFSAGFVNSLFAMQLVLFVEQEFSLTIENEDLDLENFKTINAIAHLVERKTMLLTSS